MTQPEGLATFQSAHPAPGLHTDEPQQPGDLDGKPVRRALSRTACGEICCFPVVDIGQDTGVQVIAGTVRGR
jgi:hypothetical protein